MSHPRPHDTFGPGQWLACVRRGRSMCALTAMERSRARGVMIGLFRWFAQLVAVVVLAGAPSPRVALLAPRFLSDEVYLESGASRFQWLQTPATTEIALAGITATMLSDNGARQPDSEPYPGLEVLLPPVTPLTCGMDRRRVCEAKDAHEADDHGDRVRPTLEPHPGASLAEPRGQGSVHSMPASKGGTAAAELGPKVSQNISIDLKASSHIVSCSASLRAKA
jgi:hypothetical protein